MTQRPPRDPDFFACADARRLFWLCGTLLVLSALALNARVLDFGFLYLRDDDLNVTLNPHMGGLGADRLRWMFTDWTYVRRYIPLGWLNFAATYEFAGLDPRPYHAVALALYGANTVLVYVIVLQVLRLLAPAGRPAGLASWDVGSAFLAAAWWAFHPLRVETTAWVSGNLYGQSMALLFITLAAYFGSYMARGGARAACLCLAAAAYAGSLLTYPVALGVPLLMVAMDGLRSRADPRVPFKRLLAEKAAFMVPLGAILAVTLAARFGGTEVYGAVPGMRELPALSRIAQSSYIAAYYVWKPWWPFNLSPLYDTLVDFNPTSAPFILSIAGVAAVSVIALALIRRRPVVAVFWFGYLVVAAPFFGLTEKPHMASDRYGYFLTAISAAAIAAALSRIRTGRARAIAAVASLAAIGLLGRLTWSQLRIWTDDQVQHAYVAAHLTNAELLDDFTGRLLILEFLRGDEKAASQEVASRLARNPGSLGMRKAAMIFADKRRISAYYGQVSYLAIAQEQMGLQFARAEEYREANDHFEDALRMNDRFYQAAYDRALVLLNMGRADDALGSYLLAARWASPELTLGQRHAFLDRLERLARAQERAALGRAARSALAR